MKYENIKLIINDTLICVRDRVDTVENDGGEFGDTTTFIYETDNAAVFTITITIPDEAVKDLI